MKNIPFTAYNNNNIHESVVYNPICLPVNTVLPRHPVQNPVQDPNEFTYVV